MKATIFGATALGVALAMVVPAVASAAPVVSQANGRLVGPITLAGTSISNIAALDGAQATNKDGKKDVVVDTPLDASVLTDLLKLKSGTTDLFGDNGIIQLGAVGQYAAANKDGSSAAFSGAVSQAPSLIGVGVQSGPNIGAPSGNSTAEISLGGSSDPVSLDVTLGALAASAKESASGDITHAYTLTDAGITVGGTVLSPILKSLHGPLGTLISALKVAGVDVANPISSDGTVQLSLQDLLDAAGVTNVNDLKAGTNLLQYVPTAVVNTVTKAVDGVLTTAQNEVTKLGALGLVLGLALATAKGVLDPILQGLTGTLSGPLGNAINQLAQLDVNVQTTNNDKSFTETALQVGLGPSGSLAQVNLASATVGPNAGLQAVPMVNPRSAGLAAGAGILGLGVWALAGIGRRRRSLSATAAK